MKLNFRLFMLIAMLMILPLSACAPAAAPDEEEKPVTLDPIAGTDQVCVAPGTGTGRTTEMWRT